MPVSTPTLSDDGENQRPAADALRRQAAELQAQIAQRSRALASLGNSEDQARHELDALNQQRQTEEAAIAQSQAQQKQMVPPPLEIPARPRLAPRSAPALSNGTSVQIASGRPQTTAQYPRQPTQPAPAPQRHVASYSAQTQTPRDDLANARDLVVSGRPADARQMLMLAQAQSQLRPVTPDQPLATGGSVTATRISAAIRYLDTGNTKYALRAIDIAMNSAANDTRAWPADPPPTSYGGGYPAGPAYYGGNAQR